MFHRVEEPLSRHNRELIHSLTTNHKIYANPARAIVGAPSGRPHTSESDVWIREIREIRGQNNNDLIVWYRIEKCYQHEFPRMIHELSWKLIMSLRSSLIVKRSTNLLSTEFRRDYARAIASAGLRDVDRHWLYEDENENLQQSCGWKQPMVAGKVAAQRLKRRWRG